jgi:hypothetical protein
MTRKRRRLQNLLRLIVRILAVLGCGSREILEVFDPDLTADFADSGFVVGLDEG